MGLLALSLLLGTAAALEPAKGARCERALERKLVFDDGGTPGQPQDDKHANRFASEGEDKKALELLGRLGQHSLTWDSSRWMTRTHPLAWKDQAASARRDLCRALDREAVDDAAILDAETMLLSTRLQEQTRPDPAATAEPQIKALRALSDSPYASASRREKLDKPLKRAVTLELALEGAQGRAYDEGLLRWVKDRGDQKEIISAVDKKEADLRRRSGQRLERLRSISTRLEKLDGTAAPQPIP